MAKTRRDKYDLLTLATKGALIGCDIVFVDDNDVEELKEVADYRFNYGSGEITLVYSDGEGDTLSLKRTYVVEIDNSYQNVPVKRRRKNKRPKRNDQ